MTTTPIIGAPELASGQAAPETTVNEIARYIEQCGNRVIVKDKDLATPPGSPADGDAYIVAASPTGAWSGKAKSIAFYLNSAWAFITPRAGLRAFPQDEAIEYQYSGSAWAAYTASVSLASTTETLTGTDAAKAVTPDALAALWEQGSDVASAGTVSLGEGGYFNITGTTTITDIDFATDKAGRRAWVKFAGILTLTHNASTLILPGGTSITTAAGDCAEFVSEGSDVVRCVSYTRANGAPLVASSFTPSIQSVTSSATVTPTFSDDQVNITAQAVALALANPTGTAVDGWGMSIRIKDNGTARAISYGTQYRAIGVTLPATTVISKTLYLGMIYNSADTKWDVVAVAQEA